MVSSEAGSESGPPLKKDQFNVMYGYLGVWVQVRIHIAPYVFKFFWGLFPREIKTLKLVKSGGFLNFLL